VDKMILLENSESHRKASEKKCEDMAHRLRVSEKTLQNLQRDIARYKVGIWPYWPGMSTQETQ